MTETIQTLLFMLAVLAAVAVAAKRLKIAPSILLVVAGIGIALIPGLPKVELAPEVVLLVILPPLIYSAGVAMSWREFKFNLRPIALLAFGCVVFTTCAVAAAAHYLLEFRLGGRLSARRDHFADRRRGAARDRAPARTAAPDRRRAGRRGPRQRRHRAGALSLCRRRGQHRHVFARSRPPALSSLIVVGEIIYGIAVGWLSLRLRQWARDPRVEITLSLMTPYLAFWVPAHLGGSGVLATVACGLYVSWNGPRLIPFATRLQGIFFWDLIVYLIEGLVFLVTGLQARTLIEQAPRFLDPRTADRDRVDDADRHRGALHLGVSRRPTFRAG